MSKSTRSKAKSGSRNWRIMVNRKVNKLNNTKCLGYVRLDPTYIPAYYREFVSSVSAACDSSMPLGRCMSVSNPIGGLDS
jgi:hypothetical protein